MGESCGRSEMALDLSSLALDSADDYHIRVRAAFAVAKLDDEASKLRLKTLALDYQEDDSDDSLKGCALTALWPRHISAEELFNSLTTPKNPNLLGAYQSFLYSYLVPGLLETDLPIALEWIRDREVREHDSLSPLQSAVNEILLEAWKSFELKDIVPIFTEIAFTRLQDYRPIIGHHRGDTTLAKEFARYPERRRSLALSLVNLIKDADKEVYWLVHGPTPVVLNDDVPWLIENLDSSKSEDRRRIWAILIARTLDRSYQEQVDAVFEKSRDSKELHSQLAWLFEPVQLDSPEARKMRRRYDELKDMDTIRSERVYDLRESILRDSEKLLTECETGNLDAWWQLNLVLLSSSDGYRTELEPDLKKGELWLGAELETKARILEAAKRYLVEREAHTDRWLGTNVIDRPALAGYRALRLCWDEDSDFLLNLASETWQLWASIVVAYPTVGVEEESIQQGLIELAYVHARQEAIEAARILISRDQSSPGVASLMRRFNNVDDGELTGALLDVLELGTLEPDGEGELLGFLLRRDSKRAREFASRVLSPEGADEDASRQRRLFTALSLARNSNDAGWPLIWPVVEQDSVFAEKFFLGLAERSNNADRRLLSILNEFEISELFIWLERQFPQDEDPRPEGVHMVTPRESLGRFRDSLLRGLADFGSFEACEAIQIVQAAFPEMKLGWLLQVALQAARRTTWKAPNPSEILALARDSRNWLVRSDKELLAIIHESLDRLQEILQGENPAARDLWDKLEKNKYVPVDEPAFSDYVKRYLQGDLVSRGLVLNREVQIRRGEGRAKGETTDIHIDALSSDLGGESFDLVCAVVEAKGPWNIELRNAMKTQLVDRYLRDSQCKAGLYLVGWFECDQWDEDDYRRSRASASSLQIARELFETQARELSQEGLSIQSYVLNAALR